MYALIHPQTRCYAIKRGVTDCGNVIESDLNPNRVASDYRVPGRAIDKDRQAWPGGTVCRGRRDAQERPLPDWQR